MGDLVAGDLIAKCRDLISEPSPVRFTQAYMLRAASDACRQLAMDIDHPYGRYSFDIGSGQREFQCPALCKILRIYMLGPDGSQQQIFGTDIPTLNGEIQQTYDNTSGIIRGAPPQTSQWAVQPPEAYPITHTQVGGRVPTKSTWGPHSRPSYYMFAGYIGFTIPPNTTTPATQVMLEYVVQPPELGASSAPVLFPASCKMALVWYMVSQALYSDASTGAADAMKMYEQEKGKLNDWLFSLQATRPKAIVPLTKRVGIRNRGRGGYGRW